MVRWFLFSTVLGDWLLALFERVTGLAVVPLSDVSGH